MHDDSFGSVTVRTPQGNAVPAETLAEVMDYLREAWSEYVPVVRTVVERHFPGLEFTWGDVPEPARVSRRELFP